MQPLVVLKMPLNGPSLRRCCHRGRACRLQTLGSCCFCGSLLAVSFMLLLLLLLLLRQRQPE
jgi:uncharacterized membrane protein YgdD (TMEM256/DUF423 family)